MAFYGVDLNVRVMEIQNKFKQIIKSRGGNGIHGLGRIFRAMDNNGNKKLDIEEFTMALNQYGIFPTKLDAQGLLNAYDIDKDGSISFDEFLRGMRSELSPQQLAFVDQAFALLDRDNSGEATASDIEHLYDVRCHPKFIDGSMTKEQVLEEFLNSFDGLRGNNDGKITRQEFRDYYADLAASVPSEKYFYRMLEQAWGIADESVEDVEVVIKDVVAKIRQRLITLSNNQQEEYKLKTIFEEFDVNGNGIITIDELAAMVAKLGISFERRYLQALLRKIDTNNSGAVEFNEFRDLIIVNPYK